MTDQSVVCKSAWRKRPKADEVKIRRKMNEDEEFFTEIEALTKWYAPEAEHPLKKKVKLLRKVPMLLYEESKPLNTILICRHPEERILIVKEFADLDRKKLKKISE